MADMHDCGVHCFTAWASGGSISRWIGPFDPATPVDEIQRRLEHHKLTADGREAFARGWTVALKQYLDKFGKQCDTNHVERTPT